MPSGWICKPALARYPARRRAKAGDFSQSPSRQAGRISLGFSRYSTSHQRHVGLSVDATRRRKLELPLYRLSLGRVRNTISDESRCPIMTWPARNSRSQECQKKAKLECSVICLLGHSPMKMTPGDLRKERGDSNIGDDRKDIPSSESLHLKCVSQEGGSWVNQSIEGGSSEKRRLLGSGGCMNCCFPRRQEQFS